MKLYKLGKVVSVGKSYLIFETNQTGIIVNVNWANNFTKNEEIKLFIYEYQSDYLRSVFGFRTFQERILFEDLLSISGIGPKTSMQLLKIGHKKLVEAIIGRDLEIITQVKSVGETTAGQVILELRGKYMKWRGLDENQKMPIEIKATLKTLGFNDEQIRYAISKLDPNRDLDKMVEAAIVLITDEYRNVQNNIE